MPPDVSVLNAANLCPSPARVLETVVEHTERLNREPVPSYRSEIGGSKERTRELLADFLRPLCPDCVPKDGERRRKQRKKRRNVGQNPLN